MFNGSRKRRRLPLENTLICLSGFSAETKEMYHELIERLGGNFTRDLTGSNTHLIAAEATGAKFEAALTQKSIKIVQPSWLDACEVSGTHVAEAEHSTFSEAAAASCMTLDEGVLSEGQSHVLSSKSHTYSNSSLKNRALSLLNEKQLFDSVLFSGNQFHLLGFDHNDLWLERIIRRGMGIIHWDPHPSITHVVVRLNAHSSVRNIVRSISRKTYQFQKELAFVSPVWIIDSWAADELLDEVDYPPLYQSAEPNLNNDHPVCTSETLGPNVTTTGFLKGLVFCFVPAAVPDFAVDFDVTPLERSIRGYGGRILSTKLLEALKSDARDCHQPIKRKLYVVCWGAYHPSHLEMHPLIGHITKQDLCQLVPVTPVWVQTCLSEGKVVSPRHFSSILCPSEWPWRSLTATHISVSGFSGSKRTALIHFIRAVAAYDDTMVRGQTTHLIVIHPKGEKYKKAKEWGIQIVSLEWLLHAVRCGIGEKITGSAEDKLKICGVDLGCEETITDI